MRRRTMRKILLLAGAALSSVAGIAATTATSEFAKVDFTESGKYRPSGVVNIGAAPWWVNEAALSADLFAVTNPGTLDEKITVLKEGVTSVEEIAIDAAALGSRNFRLILRAKSDADVLGELSHDIALAEVSPWSENSKGDCADGKLTRALKAQKIVPVAYSTRWEEGAGSLKLIDDKQRVLLSAEEPATGVSDLALLRTHGAHELKLRFFDKSGGTLEEYVASYEGPDPLQFLIFFR